MPTTHINGIRLFYEVTGNGPIALVLVHGSWSSHHNWDAVVPLLAKTFRVITYDRRGHCESEAPPGQGSVRDDAADLGALIEEIATRPAFVVGSSFGASIALRLAGSRPDLLDGVIAHEPPLFQLLASDPRFAPALEEAGRRVERVGARIASGDHAGAAEQFAETVALGPGSWARLPPEHKQTMIETATTFLDEIGDPEGFAIDLDALRRFTGPVLLTTGDQSPPTFGAVTQQLAEVLPNAEVRALAGTGHIPHVTNPDLYVEVIAPFARKHAAERGV